MSKCEKCGHENVKDSRFCESCGAELTETPKESTDSVTDEMPDETPKNGGKGSSGKKIAAVLIVAICVLAAIVIAVMNMGGNGGASYSDKITEADRYMEEQDYDKAETAYLEAIDIDPKEAEAYIGLSNLYMSQEKSEEAVEILSDGIDNVEKDYVGTLEDRRTDAIYEPVKQDYREKITRLFEAYDDPDTDWEELYDYVDFDTLYFDVTYENGLDDIRENEDFGFTYADIDGNGTDEMLVFIDTLSAVWTNDGKEAVCLIRDDGTTFTDLAVTDDGTLFESVRAGNGNVMGGETDTDIYFYEIDETGLDIAVLEHYMMFYGDDGYEKYKKEDGTIVDEDVIMQLRYGDDYGSYDYLYEEDSYGDYDIECMIK